MDVLSVFAQKFLEAALPVLASLLAAWLVAKIRQAWSQLSAKDPELAYWLSSGADMAVNAAEQAQLAGLISDKKIYALGVLEKYLAEHGVKLDLVVMSAAIEAAVWTEINRDKAVAEKKTGFVAN
jgi:hypothetical protein